MVSIEDVRDALDDYPDLKDKKIKKGIEMAKDILYGINAEWESHENAENAHLQASIAQTLVLHFPQNASLYEPMFQRAAEMVTSLWSSSFMLRRKFGYCRGVKQRNSNEYTSEEEYFKSLGFG